MKRLLLVMLGALSFMSATVSAADSKIYEMRTYYSPPGKLDDLHKRFREHTVKLFEKHGIENVGYWVPVDNKDNKLVYIIAHPSREEAKKHWDEFFADPDWKKAAAESEKDGKIVQKVEVVWMEKTDYSPEPKPETVAGGRVFEFRTYTTPPNGLDAINARFRDHTIKLFEKHGMKNVVYFNRMKDQKAADVTLFYILSHKDEAAGKASFDAFRKDPEWVAVKEASEKKAGGSLTIPGPDGVKSELFKATDYSPIR